MPKRSKSKRVINVSILPGEKTDGSGRVCIHLFVRDENGPLTEPHVLHQVDGDGDGENTGRKEMIARPTRGKLACGVIPSQTQSSGIIKLVHRTDDPRAATCPRCMATDDYKTIMGQLERK